MSLAMKEGLSLAASLGYHQIVAESHCLEVIEACAEVLGGMKELQF